MKGTLANCAEHQKELVSGNIFIRPCILGKKGDFVDGHKHNFDHTTIFLEGSFHVVMKDPDGTVRETDAVSPTHLLIRKEVEHRIELTSEGAGRFWCVYSHRDQNGGVIQESNHNLDAYG